MRTLTFQEQGEFMPYLFDRSNAFRLDDRPYRPLKPRRRSVRRQAGLRTPHLGRPTYVGPQPSTPIRLTGWQTTILLVVATVSFIALLAWAGFHVEPFRP